MSQPANLSHPEQPPGWVNLGGLFFGLAASLIFLPFYSEHPLLVHGSFREPWMFVTLGSYEIALVISGIFGVLAAWGSWSWAVRTRHPVLAACERWTPLRGRWLVIPCALALAPIFWITPWLLLGALFSLPDWAILIVVVAGVLLGVRKSALLLDRHG